VETEVTFVVFMTVALAAFTIGLSKGGLPGLGPLVTVIVALAVPSSVAIGVLLPLLMVGDVGALWALRSHIDGSIVGPVTAGSVIGVAATSLTLASLSPAALEVGIVVVVLLFVAYRFAVLSGHGPQADGSILGGPKAGAVAGAVAGVTSTIAHSGGPPIAMHLLARQVQPLTFAGTSAAIFWAINWLKVPGYAAAGLLQPDLLIRLSPTAVLIFPGVLLGRWAAGRLNRGVFEIFVLIGLTAGAVLLLVT
jgi:uncharacterized membrane protein YfcA